MTEKTIEELLADLFRRGIRLTEADGRLRLSGPEGELDAALRATLSRRKAEILKFLRHHGADSGGPRMLSIPVATPRPAALPLSFAQQRLWFLQQLPNRRAAYNLPLALRVDGRLDVAAFESSLEAIVARHEVLRTRYPTVDGAPVQEVLAEPRLDLESFDLRSSGDAEEAVRAAARAAALEPFDLATQRPLRVALYQIAESAWVVLFTLHHIAADAWSLQILLRELATLYTARLLRREGELPELPVQYPDFAIWQRSNATKDLLSSDLAYWRERLGGELQRLQLPTDFPRSRVETANGGVVEFRVDATTTRRLRQVGTRHSASLFMTLLAALNVLLYRYSGQRDLLVGTPVANRHRAEIETLIGLFVNTLVIRTRIDPRETFDELLRAVRARTLEANDHQDLPFDKLVEDLSPERDPSVSPIFQVKFRLENAPAETIELPGLTLRRLPHQVTPAKLDLSVDMYETADGLVGGFEYNRDLFEQATIARMAEQFVALLPRLAEKPDAPLGAVSVLTAQERRRQRDEWNASARPYRDDACYHHLFEAQVARNPDAVAAVFDGETRTELTYSELDQRANRLAHALIARGVGPDCVVAICLDRSLEMVIAMLGVLKAGAAYLPLDASYPADRLEYMLADADVQVLVSSSALQLPTVDRRIDLDREELGEYSLENPSVPLTPDHLAYVIYTSGSTGRPKGTLIPHGGLVNLTEDKIRKCDVRPGDCVLQFFSFSFDGSVPEFVMTLAVGARLLLAPAATMLPGPGLRDLMLRNGVTHITITPSALASLPHHAYPDLRMVLVGGEAPSRELIQQWSRGRRFINAYGPTETTVNASMVHCGNGEPLEPTVRPSANKQLYVLDGDLQIVPVGAVGELHIGGVGLARGYLHQSALTAERFIPDPFTHDGPAGVLYRSGDLASYLPDGRIRLLGRIDQQTKIRGFRVELGEVERVLEQHPQVRVGLVTIREHAGDRRLLAYGVSHEETPAPATEVRQFLAEKLPRFMVPAAFTWLPELPLTPNGKVDFDALPCAIDARDVEKAPRDDNERRLAALFAEVLGLDAVGIHDNFFDLGGHSLLATRLVARLTERHGVDITVLDLFDAPSVAALAQRIEQKQHLERLLDPVDRDEDREEIAL